MRKSHLTAAVLLGGTLIASAAMAQPGTNGASGTGPEGAAPGVVNGSGMHEPGTASKMSRHGSSSKMLKHHSSKKSQNKM